MSFLDPPDRRVHAWSNKWELVRYDRAGKWYLEWVAQEPPPGSVGEGGWIRPVTATGRCHLTIHDAVVATVGLGLAHDPDVYGGSTYDRELARYQESSFA